VVAVTIDRTDRRNAVDHETLDELAAALDACGERFPMLSRTPRNTSRRTGRGR